MNDSNFITSKEPARTRAESDEPLQEVSGVVNRIVYRAEDSGYTVLTIAPAGSAGAISKPGFMDFGDSPSGKSTSGEITVVGNCEAVWVGESLRATGKWVHHKRHGRQFEAEKIACLAPATVEGIRMFLSSGMMKGVGPVMADRIVDAFGDDTLRIIEKESKRLQEIPGIGTKTREKIKNSWIEHKSVRDLMIFLRGHGVGTGQAMRIHRQYGDQAVAVVSKNPYRLCRDVWGIGFKSADRIAMSIGIPRESDIRARAGIQYTLQTMAEEGHCFCPWEVLMEEGQALLEIPSEILDQATKHEIEQGSLREDEGNVYLAPLYHAEVEVASRIRDLLKIRAETKTLNAEGAVSWAETRMGINFAPAQRSALQMALTDKVSIITGGPGVGKTTIVKALVDVFSAKQIQVALAAPTGRAAKRMAEATGFEAKTIHRLLKFLPMTGSFEFCAEKPLEADVVILDEVSMIDINLMQSFLRALPLHARLVLVGDSDQLPSVGPGNVLKDLIASDVVHSCRLDMIFRQKAQSWIVQNAHRVNHGEFLEAPGADEESDFFMIQSDEPEDTISRMVELVTRRIPDRFGFNPRTEIQVLTPMRKNQLGADNLNTILQQALNPSGTSHTQFGRIYRTGDRVMQMRNNYDKEVYNGDIGIISGLDPEQQELYVTYDGRIVEYQFNELDELILSYACSIHKSQGSEYPAVVILLSTQHYKLLQRNLLYTALTRGKKLVCLIGSRKAVHIAIANSKTLLRRTTLTRRLQGEGSIHFARTV